MTKRIEFTNPSQSIECMANVVKAHDDIFKWGRKNGIVAANGATAAAQIKKLITEANETLKALEEGNDEEVVDGFGDILVCLIQAQRLYGASIDETSQKSWNDIKDRTGTMKCGIFVKKASLDQLNSCKTALWAYNKAETPEEVEAAIELAKKELAR